ncbi:MAG: AMP-binding protein, partial [Rhodoplanes sp.]
MSGNLFDLIRSRIASADKTLIETASGERISYGDMLARSGRLAQALVRRGVGPGDRVAVQVEKTPENLMLLLATLRAGAVYLPLNTAYTIAELDYFIGDAEPTLVVCDPAKRDGVSAIALARNAAVDTLDACGRGSLIDLAAQSPSAFADV